MHSNKFIVVNVDGGQILKAVGYPCTINGKIKYTPIADGHEVQVVATECIDDRVIFEERLVMPRDTVVECFKKMHDIGGVRHCSIVQHEGYISLRYQLLTGYEPEIRNRRPTASKKDTNGSSQPPRKRPGRPSKGAG